MCSALYLLFVALCAALSVNGSFLHSWSFEGNLVDEFGTLNGTGINLQYSTDSPKEQCNQHLGGNSTATFHSLAIDYSKDFIISFYVYFSNNVSGYVPILAHGGCSDTQKIYFGILDGSTLKWILEDGIHWQNISVSQDGLLNNWHHVAFGRGLGSFGIAINGIVNAAQNPEIDFNLTADLTVGVTACGEIITGIFIDELQIFDAYYNAADIYQDRCISYAPVPEWTNVAENHTSVGVAALSFYAQFTNPIFTFTINGNVFTAKNNSIVVNISSSEINQPIVAILGTKWGFSKLQLTSAPIYLLPVKGLRHVWSFDGNYTDSVGGLDHPSSNTTLPRNFELGICSVALQTSNETGTRYSLHYNISDFAYQNDFTISFWMHIYGNKSDTYAIIGQRQFCSSGGDSWDLRYYGSSQELALEVYTASGVGSLMGQYTSVSGIDIFNNWQHIAITRQLYNVSFYINGTIYSSKVQYMNPNITYPLGISEDPCFFGTTDPTQQAPKVLYDELQIFDLFVNPAEIFENRCIQTLAQPSIIYNPTSGVYSIKISPSFYAAYTSVSYYIFYTINGVPEWSQKVNCGNSSSCSNMDLLFAPNYVDQNIVFQVVASFPFGNYSSDGAHEERVAVTCDSTAAKSCPVNMQCIGFMCACVDGFTMTPAGTGCIGTCGNAACDLTENCTSCPMDCPCSCEIKNGGCDYKMVCNDTSGVPQCGKCPNGTHLNVTTCQSYCGDGFCNASYAENCVTCPMDCKTTSCDVCGDGTCGSNEDCTTCPIDCLCAQKTCPEGCANGGTCSGGMCSCVPPWAGSSCKSQNIPITAIGDKSGPTMAMKVNSTTSSGNTSVEFFVALSALEELDSKRNLVRAIYVASMNFTSNVTITESFEMYSYSSSLENQATLIVVIWAFLKPASIEFAGETTIYSANSLKISVTVKDWPFQDLANFLAIKFNSSKNTQNAKFGSYSEGEDVKWMTVSMYGVLLYAQFENTAIVDGRVRTIAYSLNEDNSVSALLPHFWDNAAMDPQYSVLVDQGNGSGHFDMPIVEIAVPVAVGTILLSVFLIWGIFKLRTCVRIKKSFSEIKLQEHGE